MEKLINLLNEYEQLNMCRKFDNFAMHTFENSSWVDSILEDMETHAHYVMDNISYVMNYGRYGLRNNIYGLGLSTIAEVCFDLGGGKKLCIILEPTGAEDEYVDDGYYII